MERASEVDAPSSVCPPDCPSCHKGPGWKTPCPTRIARYDAQMSSAANRHLILLTRTLELARTLAESYLEYHPEGCECVGCRLNDEGTLGNIRHDVRGIAWALMASSSYLNGVCLGGVDDLNGENFSDDFSELAEESHGLEAAGVAEGLWDIDGADDEPEPVAVAGRKPR
jgi:hypothetical protein